MLYFPRKSRTTWHELRLQYIREKRLLSPLHSEASSSLPVGLLMDCSTRNIYKCIVFIEGGVKNDCLLVMITKTSYFGCVFFVFLSLVRPAGRWCGSCWEEEKLLFTLEQCVCGDVLLKYVAAQKTCAATVIHYPLLYIRSYTVYCKIGT